MRHPASSGHRSLGPKLSLLPALASPPLLSSPPGREEAGQVRHQLLPSASSGAEKTEIRVQTKPAGGSGTGGGVGWPWVEEGLHCSGTKATEGIKPVACLFYPQKQFPCSFAPTLLSCPTHASSPLLSLDVHPPSGRQFPGPCAADEGGS